MCKLVLFEQVTFGSASQVIYLLHIRRFKRSPQGGSFLRSGNIVADRSSFASAVLRVSCRCQFAHLYLALLRFSLNCAHISYTRHCVYLIALQSLISWSYMQRYSVACIHIQRSCEVRIGAKIVIVL